MHMYKICMLTSIFMYANKTPFLFIFYFLFNLILFFCNNNDNNSNIVITTIIFSASKRSRWAAVARKKMRSTHQNEIKTPTWNTQIWQLQMVGAKSPKCLVGQSHQKWSCNYGWKEINKMMLCLKLISTHTHIHTPIYGFVYINT